MMQTAELSTTNGSFVVLGERVAMAGNTIVAGGGASGGLGVYVFVKPANGWVNGTQTSVLSTSDGQGGAGGNVSVAIGGNTVVAGNSTAYKAGAAYVFVEPTGGWTDM